MVISFLIVAAAAVLAVPLLSGLGGGSSRERDRRLRWIARHPEQVNTGDIGRLLARELGRDDVDLILDRAAALGVRPWTMLSWIQRYDVPTLAVVIAAEVSHEELLLHLGHGTLPDLDELEVFAAINGLPAPAPKRARRAAPRPALARPAPPAAATTPVATTPSTGAMPPIFEPGSWPYDQFTDLPSWPDAPDAPEGPGHLAA